MKFIKDADGAIGGGIGDLGGLGGMSGDSGDVHANVALVGASACNDAIAGASSGNGAMGGGTETIEDKETHGDGNGNNQI